MTQETKPDTRGIRDCQPPSNQYSKLFKGVAQQQTVQPPDYSLQRAIAAAKPMERFDLNEDAATLARVSHALRPNESLGAFYMRSQLSRQQIHMLQPSEILARVLQAEKNEAAEPTDHFEPQIIPDKFSISL
jgi:hypothetical protein